MGPIWLWGVVASSLFAVPASAYALYDINKNDPTFKKFLDERNPLKNIFLFLKSIAKVLIPFVNIIYAFSIISKVARYGFKGLKSVWKNRILKNKNKVDNIKYNNKVRIDKTKKFFNKIFGKNKEKELTNTKNQVQENTSTKTIAKNTQTVKKNVPVTDKVINLNVRGNSYQALIDLLDYYNNSDISTEKLSTLYKKEYWELRHEYDKEIDQNIKLDLYNRFSILYNKHKELKQLRNNTQVLTRK